MCFLRAFESAANNWFVTYVLIYPISLVPLTSVMILLYLVVISLLCFKVFSDASISFAIAISSPCVSNLNLIGVFDFWSIN